MKIAKLALSKYVLWTLAILALLIGFNASRSRLESELLAQFNEWYSDTAPLLAEGDDASTSLPTVSVTIRLSGPLYTGNPSWTFPPHSLSDPEERSQTDRVLQLISESKVFQFTPVAREVASENYIHISVTDQAHRFDTVVASKEAADNIQLQNLMKLLQIFGSTPARSENPNQL